MKRAYLFCVFIAVGLIFCKVERPRAQELPCNLPGWNGTLLIDGETRDNWSVEMDRGSSGELAVTQGLIGQAIQLNWNIGAGDWVQGKYTFTQPADLSNADIFGVSIHGGGPSEMANTVSIMFADVNGSFYGYDMEGKSNGINQTDRWLINLPLPKKLFWHFWGPDSIDWSRIDRFFIVVKRPGEGLGGGSGQIRLDHLQYDKAALWARRTEFEIVAPDSEALSAASDAVDYILSQQKSSTGLFVSWKEEPSPKAHLYDQALVLIALIREGDWDESSGEPRNKSAQAAKSLADFLVRSQKDDGYWARTWNPETGEELVDDRWVGDQAWCVMALFTYCYKSGDVIAHASAQRGARWLASQIDSSGKATLSTEGNVDAWWALMTASRFSDADKIRDYLLGTVWDADLKYWWRGYKDPVVAMDTATWLSFFARHPMVNEPEKAKAALSFVGRTLATRSDDGLLCGFDGMGPISVWNEGTAQYVTAGGPGAQEFLDMLLSQQRTDGSMPGSPDNHSTDTFGWMSDWSGLAPTAWLYFAIKGHPFPLPFSLGLGEGWNLISLPFSPDDSSAEKILDSIRDSYSVVWGYDEGQWKMFDPANPDLSDLDVLESGRGYWIKMIRPAALVFQGTTAPVTRELKRGWNLVGYNAFRSAPVSDVLSTLIDQDQLEIVWAYQDGQWQRYAPGASQLSDLVYMMPGSGYWVKVKGN